MSEGRIVKALSGYYYVLPDGCSPLDREALVQCRARGLFKKQKITPLVGDRVEFARSGAGDGTVTRILPRHSELFRPPIANVDQAVLVFSVDEPALSVPLLDKFLVHIEAAGLDTVICLTKGDLLAEPSARAAGQVRDVVELYETVGYPVVITSTRDGTGLDRLREALRGKISVFAGQSGVGKSSLVNALEPGLELDTNEISAKLGRGRHTTRHVELHPLQFGGWVADTPGFSQLDFSHMEAEQLSDCFREFRQLKPACKFRGCLHLREPGCAVREAVEAGSVAQSRIEHYHAFLQELLERKRRY